MPKQVAILGVTIDQITKSTVLEQIKGFLSSHKQHHLATVNPEFIMAAQKESRFKTILNNCDLNVADGIGILWAAKFLSLQELEQSSAAKNRNSIAIAKKLRKLVTTGASLVFFPQYCRSVIPERISGVDLMLDICTIAQQQNKKVFLLGGSKFNKKTPEKVTAVLKEKFPQLAFEHFDGPLLKKDGTAKNKELAQTLEVINNFQSDILLVAISHPKAQYFIDNYLSSLPSVKIAMGVGGAFEFIGGVVPRAPQFMRVLGLEWLFRVVRQPWRFSRIITATIRFIASVYKNG